MTFQPKSGGHAIVEVVFGLSLARDLNPAELEVLAKSHDQWRDDLPRLARGKVIQLVLGDNPAAQSVQMPQPLAGVVFERLKPDGNLEWRLRADEKALYVNCLDYSGWSTVWPRVRDYLSRASEAIVATDNAVQGLMLQYVDVFEWSTEPDQYRLDELLSRESSFLPSTLWDKGPFWHLHQGWYRYENIPAPGRLLERIHLDGVVDNDGTPTIRMDTYLNLELEKSIERAAFFDSSNPIGDQLFDQLHDLNKGLLRSYITLDIAKRIGLDG